MPQAWPLLQSGSANDFCRTGPQVGVTPPATGLEYRRTVSLDDILCAVVGRLKAFEQERLKFTLRLVHRYFLPGSTLNFCRRQGVTSVVPNCASVGGTDCTDVPLRQGSGGLRCVCVKGDQRPQANGSLVRRGRRPAPNQRTPRSELPIRPQLRYHSRVGCYHLALGSDG